MSPPAKTDALVLRARAYGDSDKIVTFLTRDLGKLTGIAKGAAKSRRRFVGSLEPATEVTLSYRLRSQSDLCFVEAVDILRAPRNLTRDLDRYAYSIYAIEVLDCMVEGREAEAPVYELARDVFAAIDGFPGAPGAEILRWFELRLLTLCGLEPRLSRCRRCGRSTEGGDEPLRFDPAAGTIACRACPDGLGVPVTAAVLTSVRSLRDASLSAIAPLPSPLAGEVRVFLQNFLQHHLRRPLKSLDSLRALARR